MESKVDVSKMFLKCFSSLVTEIILKNLKQFADIHFASIWAKPTICHNQFSGFMYGNVVKLDLFGLLH